MGRTAKTRRAGRRKETAVPSSCGALISFLEVPSAAEAIGFYKKAFGAKVVTRIPGPYGTVTLAVVEIGGSWLALKGGHELPPPANALADAREARHFYLYVKDVDAAVARAEALGATDVVTDDLPSERTATLQDPYGFTWILSARKFDVAMRIFKRLMARSARATEMADAASAAKRNRRRAC